MEKKTSKNIWLVIVGLLTVVPIIVNFIIMPQPFLPYICGVVALLCNAVYCFFFYNKPHGNLLKAAFLIFAISKLVADVFILCTLDTQFSVIGAISVICAAFVCYCAGRLNRIEQNKYMLVIVDVFYFVLSVMECVNMTRKNFLGMLLKFDFPITLTALLIAYFVRYKEHKEAGLSDAPKEKK